MQAATHCARRVKCLAMVSTVCGVVACSELTNVPTPDIISPNDITNAVGANQQRAGAIAAFANGLAMQALMTGMLGDEFADRSGTIAADQRRVPLQQTYFDFPYDRLTSARINALAAASKLELYSPTPSWHIAEMFAYAGYVDIMDAEGLCSPLPLADVVNGSPSAVRILSRSELLKSALVDFDSATAHVAQGDSIATLVSVGRARALLDSGDWSGAVGASQGVPSGYAYTPPYDGVHQFNVIFSNVSALDVSVSNLEGGNGLDFVSAQDPRLLIANLGLGAIVPESVYAPTKYSSLASPVVLASAIEASLIRAEVLLPQHGGPGSAWLDTLNALRTDGTFSVSGVDTTYNPGSGNVAGLRLLSDPGSDSGRVTLLFRERAFWLFGYGERLGDMRRLVRQYSRPIESVYPHGPYEGGPGTYGSDVVFRPFGEQGTAGYSGCTNTGP